MQCRLVFAALVALCISHSPAVAEEAQPPNVLLIMVDDLRPLLACYGQEAIVTPNIDRLAQSGVLFNRAYCNVPVCGASRASMMSGLRPTPTRFVGWRARADKDAPEATTLNTHFKQHGYRTVSHGKVFHYPDDNAQGWSKPAWRPSSDLTLGYELDENEAIRAKSKTDRGPAYEGVEAPDENYADAQVTQHGIDDLRALASSDEPFFLAVGLFRPHLPFVAPKKYWDLYAPADIRPMNYFRPKNAPGEAIHTWGELRLYSDIPKQGAVSDQKARDLIHGYAACVSFIDAQVGRLLDELETLELEQDTIVVFTSDHGWNLGEHTLWCKHSCFETSMQVPLIVRAPGGAAGRQSDGLTELIDIYPTLCKLTGLPLPEHLDGQSFADRVENSRLPGKPYAIGRYSDGDTIRTDRYRLTEYTSRGKVTARMLYDHQHDPSENANIAGAASQQQIVKELTKLLHEHQGRD